MARLKSLLAAAAIDQAIGLAQCGGGAGEGLEQRLQLRKSAPLGILAGGLQPGVDGHSSECQCAAQGNWHRHEVMVYGTWEVVPGELDREIDTERARIDPATALRKKPIAITQFALDSSHSSTHERVAAKA